VATAAAGVRFPCNLVGEKKANPASEIGVRAERGRREKGSRSQSWAGISLFPVKKRKKRQGPSPSGKEQNPPPRARREVKKRGEG